MIGSNELWQWRDAQGEAFSQKEQDCIALKFSELEVLRVGSGQTAALLDGAGEAILGRLGPAYKGRPREVDWLGAHWSPGRQLLIFAYSESGTATSFNVGDDFTLEERNVVERCADAVDYRKHEMPPVGADPLEQAA